MHGTLAAPTLPNMRRSLLLLSLLSSVVHGQVPQGGVPYHWGQRARANDLPTFAPSDPLEEARHTEPTGLAFRYGTQRWLQADLDTEGLWDSLPGGLLRGRLRLSSPGAAMLAVQFERFDLPDGALLFVIDAARTHYLGGFGQANELPDGTFATALLPGDAVVLELQVPAERRAECAIVVGSVTHAFHDPFSSAAAGTPKDYDPGYQSAACHTNVACPAASDWQTVKRATAMFLRPDGNGCTGTLVNNTANNGTPYFLLANHCYQPNTSGWVFYFNYESTGCTGSSGSTSQTITGCTLKASDYTDDFALVQLSSTPPASYQPYYAGWDRSGTTPTRTVTIEHPLYDVKKIAFDDQAPTSYSSNGTNFWRMYWDSGIVQSGSSGSPLYDQNKRLVGHVVSGAQTCTNAATTPSGAVKLTSSFDGSAPSNRLRDWLDPANSTTVINGYDPGAVPVQPVRVKLKVMLEGAYETSNGLMRGTLRSNGQVPLTEPYTALGFDVVNGSGGETTTSAVLAATGSASVVDWVRVELRNKANSGLLVAVRHALLLRNGTVVDVDGTSDVAFSVAADNYYIAVRHRNHLGAMLATPQALSTTATLKDLTVSATALYGGTSATKSVNGVRCLYAGDANASGHVKYSGSDNDRDPILQKVGGLVPTNTVNGYHKEDLNLDGVVRYTGTANDRDLILNNIGGTVPSSVLLELLP